MQSKRIVSVGLLILLMMFLSSCASSVKRADDVYSFKYAGQKFKKINVSLNSETQEKLKDNSLFNADKLSEAVKRQMNGKGLLSDVSQDSIEIIVTNIRTRSSFSAVMFGFMAGSDQLEGNVSLKNPDGKVLNSFTVSASYALGGLAGGQEAVRMNWLYDKFAELTVQNILGEKTD